MKINYSFRSMPHATMSAPTERSHAEYAEGSGEPRLAVPALASFYAAVRGLWYPLIRITPAALLLIMHGFGKFMAGPAPVIASMTKYGIEPAIAAGFIVIFLETVGAICIVFGLFTRFFAAALAIEFAVLAFYVHAPWGPAYSGTTYQLVLTWHSIFVAIALRGGGPYSLDRKIGCQL